MSEAFMRAVANRRSYYAIGNEEIVSRKIIQNIVERAVAVAPSAFNSQSARIIVLFGAEHQAFWNIVMQELRKVVPEGRFAPTEQKIESFAAGYGTVLFFENQTVITGLQDKFPAYAGNFPLWSQQASGMLQFIIWTALEAEGLGASLQHYSPLVDAAVAERWQTPDSWQLIAQMPFGAPLEKPGEKQTELLSERIRVFF